MGLRKSSNAAMKIYRENKRIADNIKTIDTRTTSDFTVNINDNFSTKKPMDANKKRRLMQLNHDNLNLLQRLENVKSCYDTASIQKSRQ
jgi:hypothetical protein